MTKVVITLFYYCIILEYNQIVDIISFIQFDALKWNKKYQLLRETKHNFISHFFTYLEKLTENKPL